MNKSIKCLFATYSAYCLVFVSQKMQKLKKKNTGDDEGGMKDVARAHAHLRKSTKPRKPTHLMFRRI